MRHLQLGKDLLMSIKKIKILEVAIELARELSYQKITREAIAERLNISTALITYYFGTVEGLKDAVMKKAVDDELLDIICQGLASHNKIAKDCAPQLKFKAAAKMLTE